jgi:hypothetical protein
LLNLSYGVLYAVGRHIKFDGDDYCCDEVGDVAFADELCLEVDGE